MKFTTHDWTRIQDYLPKEGLAVVLWAQIENRTFGKRWTQQVAIGLSKNDEELCTTALAAANEARRAVLAAEAAPEHAK